eukprot:1156237-Pelagomonas_calceolata.AAC.3
MWVGYHCIQQSVQPGQGSILQVAGNGMLFCSSFLRTHHPALCGPCAQWAPPAQPVSAPSSCPTVGPAWAGPPPSGGHTAHGWLPAHHTEQRGGSPAQCRIVQCTRLAASTSYTSCTVQGCTAHDWLPAHRTEQQGGSPAQVSSKHMATTRLTNGAARPAMPTASRCAIVLHATPPAEALHTANTRSLGAIQSHLHIAGSRPLRMYCIKPCRRPAHSEKLVIVCVSYKAAKQEPCNQPAGKWTCLIQSGRAGALHRANIRLLCMFSMKATQAGALHITSD